MFEKVLMSQTKSPNSPLIIIIIIIIGVFVGFFFGGGGVEYYVHKLKWLGRLQVCMSITFLSFLFFSFFLHIYISYIHIFTYFTYIFLHILLLTAVHIEMYFLKGNNVGRKTMTLLI